MNTQHTHKFEMLFRSVKPVLETGLNKIWYGILIYGLELILLHQLLTLFKRIFR